MKKKITIVLTLLMMVTLIMGCGDQKTIKTDEGKLKVETGKATFEGKDGSKTEVNISEKGGEASLPEGYPKDLVPIIADSKINLANKNDNDGKTTYLVSLSSSKSGKEAYEFYKNVLSNAQDLNSSEMDKVYSVAGVKENKMISVMIIQDDDETSIQIGIEPQQ